VVTAPDLKAYRSYRDYLRDFYEYRKSRSSGFSYRLFASKAGIKSPNYLQLVIQGKRNLSIEMAERVATAMGCKSWERDYFVALVAQENASSPEEKLRAHQSVLKTLKKMVCRQIPSAQSQVLSHWYHLVVRELVFLPAFQPDGEWISVQLRNLISPEQAEESLQLLIEGGFLEKGPKGEWQAKDPVIDTGDDLGWARVLETHLQTLKVWRGLLETLSHEERELGLINIPIAKDKIPEFKARLRAFQDEIIGWVQDEKNPEQVVQLGIYLVPISETVPSPRS
jgi:uncharacterized protein (TIGR02147 family)